MLSFFSPGVMDNCGLNQINEESLLQSGTHHLWQMLSDASWLTIPTHKLTPGPKS